MPNEDRKLPVHIKVVGIGGAGNNAINTMVEAGVGNVDFVGINTDLQDLAKCKAHVRIQIGRKLTNGQGAGADPAMGQKSAEESKLTITDMLKGADMVFITAGMGGGTGTGAAPIVAQIAKEMGILTVAVVTTPFAFEGTPRMTNAKIGIKNLRKVVDAIMVVPNQKLMVVDESLSIDEAFKHSDEILINSIYGITDLFLSRSMINLDFADLKTIISNGGTIHMGIGKGKGDNRVNNAVCGAVSNSLLDTNIEGAKRVLLNIKGKASMKEIDVITGIIRHAIHPNANLISGFSYGETEDNEIIVTVIATDFAQDSVTVAQPVQVQPNQTQTDVGQRVIQDPIITQPEEWDDDDSLPGFLVKINKKNNK